MRRAILFSLIGLLISLGPAPLHAGIIVYEIDNYPGLQSGYTLSGSITVSNGTTITAWNYTITNGTVAGTANSTDGGAHILDNTNVLFSSSTISLPTGGTTGQLFFTDTNGTDLDWNTTNNGTYYGTAGGTQAWNDQPVPATALNDWTIATATPEPATLTLLGIGIAGMAGYGWRKRKQTAA